MDRELNNLLFEMAGLAVVAFLIFLVGYATGNATGRNQVYQDAWSSGAGQWGAHPETGIKRWEWYSESHFVEPVIARQHDREFGHAD